MQDDDERAWRIALLQTDRLGVAAIPSWRIDANLASGATVVGHVMVWSWW